MQAQLPDLQCLDSLHIVLLLILHLSLLDEHQFITQRYSLELARHLFDLHNISPFLNISISLQSLLYAQRRFYSERAVPGCKVGVGRFLSHALFAKLMHRDFKFSRGKTWLK
jgi:hypothetical protein